MNYKTNSQIIAISGLKNSGKGVASEMVQYLLNAPKPFRTYWWYRKIRFPGKWKIISFAKPLKEVLSNILGVKTSKFEDRSFKENKFVYLYDFRILDKYLLDDSDILSDNKFTKAIKSGEPLPQNTYLSIRQLMQYVGTNVLQTYLGRRVWINSTLKHKEPFIISDLRFIEEFNAVKEKGGTVIYIKRDSAKPGTHQSEKEVLDLYNQGKFDSVIDNNGTLKDLFNNLKEIIWQVKK